jgi:hypothetical protein
MPSATDPGVPADLIASLASANEAEVVGRAGANLTLVFKVLQSDGRLAPYRLHVEAAQPVVRVREDAPLRLPTECYERHITPGGWFCMNHPTADPLEVVDAASAQRWWSTLLVYLRRQEQAARSRRWPGRAWAHGPAAKAQWAAERAAAGLGPLFTAALDAGRLTAVAFRGGGGPFLQLRRDGRRLYSVWADHRRVATLGQACFCGSGRPLRACGDHAVQAAELACELMRWRAEEARFWERDKGGVCCGTMKSCPRRKPAPSNDETPSPAQAAA